MHTWCDGGLAITSFENPLYHSQTYFLYCSGQVNAIVIDPGNPDNAEIVDFAEVHGKTVSLVILTHEHYDHIAGVNQLKQRYDCHIICSAQCSSRIGNPTLNFSRYLVGYDFAAYPADITCEEISHELVWCGTSIKFLNTPGHSIGSICVALESRLFTGDILIENTPTVTKLPGGNRQALRESFELIKRTFTGDTVIYPGHGSSFCLGNVDFNMALGQVVKSCSTVRG